MAGRLHSYPWQHCAARTQAGGPSNLKPPPGIGCRTLTAAANASVTAQPRPQAHRPQHLANRTTVTRRAWWRPRRSRGVPHCSSHQALLGNDFQWDVAVPARSSGQGVGPPGGPGLSRPARRPHIAAHARPRTRGKNPRRARTSSTTKPTAAGGDSPSAAGAAGAAGAPRAADPEAAGAAGSGSRRRRRTGVPSGPATRRRSSSVARPLTCQSPPPHLPPPPQSLFLATFLYPIPAPPHTHPHPTLLWLSAETYCGAEQNRPALFPPPPPAHPPPRPGPPTPPDTHSSGGITDAPEPATHDCSEAGDGAVRGGGKGGAWGTGLSRLGSGRQPRRLVCARGRARAGVRAGACSPGPRPPRAGCRRPGPARPPPPPRPRSPAPPPARTRLRARRPSVCASACPPAVWKNRHRRASPVRYGWHY